RQKAFGINGCRVKEARISSARVALTLETMPDYPEPKHNSRLEPGLTDALILKFRIGSEAGGEMTQVSVNGERLGYYSAAQLKEGISWDWRRHQSALAEAAQKLNVERVFVGVQEVELGGVIEDHGN
ncbi:MAG TPA: hypothetical protein DER58_10565, partial [Firmicutes bacterium]|nr:hypothetical protein [Bacillota bacterium]HCF92898.1 hypothetical protein [Bacillota bacterium]